MGTNIKRGIGMDVFTATQERVKYCFDNFDKIYVAFSGGKDSSVLLHIAMMEAIKRNKRIGVLLIDLEAQYYETIAHCERMFFEYKDFIDLHWVCAKLKLRNAVSSFEPTWYCWDETKKDLWVRGMPDKCKQGEDYPFFIPGMEFEEFVSEWGIWYAGNNSCCGLIGIRADESLNRFRTVCGYSKNTFNGKLWTTQLSDTLHLGYPIYDWKTRDIWIFNRIYSDKSYNHIYDLMNKAGVPISKQRLCQPFGDDQKQGLWLYHILEPETWANLLKRVSGVNSGALYIQEHGSINGQYKIDKPDSYSWETFLDLLMATIPPESFKHYAPILKRYIAKWKGMGYDDGIPDECPSILESLAIVPSYRMICKSILRNDWWCRGIGLTQPRSEVYGEYLAIRGPRKRKAK
jgi:predicted phosphoadenosine phosphosulfate sulfurtransferase